MSNTMSSPFEYYFPPIFNKLITEKDNMCYQRLVDCLSSPYVSDLSPCVESIELEIDMMIDNKEIGKVIGKGGNVISKIREESGAIIKIFDKRFGTKRKIKICGKESNIKIAKDKIIQCILVN